MISNRAYRYRVVDVFTTQPLEGNPLAVFPDAAGIDEATMQKIAKEMNLSETVFVLPATRPDCDIAVRIFTPTREMVFAGHPTVGTGFVLLDERIMSPGRSDFVLEESIGPVALRVEKQDRPLIWLRTPPIRFGRTFEREAAAQALRLHLDDLLEVAPQLVTAGNPTVFVAVREKGAVDRAWLESGRATVFEDVGEGPGCVFIFTPVPGGAYSRMFAPELGVIEDPATGSSTGPLAAYMMKHALISVIDGTRFVSEQGTKMGRRSLLHVLIHGKHGSDGIEVGGYVTPVAEGVMRL
jgi:trans-2,3-dihydro-3-hydroxyanthranilate isomerase